MEFKVAENKKRTRVFIARGKSASSVKIPMLNKQGEYDYQMNIHNNYLLNNKGLRIPVTKTIKFHPVVAGLNSYSNYSTSDAHEIAELDKKVKDGTSSIITQEMFDVIQNPEAAKNKQRFLTANRAMVEAQVEITRRDDKIEALEADRDKFRTTVLKDKLDSIELPALKVLLGNIKDKELKSTVLKISDGELKSQLLVIKGKVIENLIMDIGVKK